MVNSTKDLILKQLNDLTENFDFTQVNQFTAQSISVKMHVSRSLASQYLNELVKEKLVMKINSRPVYFLHRKKMEELYGIKFQEDDFYDLEDVKQYVVSHSKKDGDYSRLIGSTHSLSSLIKQMRESFEYPPNGLPIIVYGDKGVGKHTLCTTIYENAARKGLIDETTKFIRIEVSPTNSQTIILKLFGDSQNKGIIDSYNHLILMICNAQYMSDIFQEKLSQLIETIKGKQKNKNIRFMFISDLHPQGFMNESLSKNIPVILEMPSLDERSIEEKEELIVHFSCLEGQAMNKKIILSSTVLRALTNGNYENNLIGLKSTIQKMCASALREFKYKDEVIIRTYDLPKYLLETMPIVIDEEIVYIDTTTYQRSEEVNYILDYLSRIIKPFQKQNNIETAIKESKHNFDLLIEYLSFKQKIPSERIKGLEISVKNILEVILKKRYINLPSGFSSNFSKIIYISEIYKTSLHNWMKDNKQIIDETINYLKDNLLNEALIVDEMSRLISNNLEIETNDILSIMLLIYLHHYNKETLDRKIFGMIVCHGYSTATSIAEATNTLLGNYIFDAVDMPLDITMDEVKDLILERLQYMNRQADVIVMVDMGSLEQLGNSLSHTINCNVGVINNVSTRLALNVGNCIIREMDIVSILEKVSESSKASYTIVTRKKNDVILFTSESGVHLAQRMRELFEVSFPSQIPVDLEVFDFNQLAIGDHLERFENKNILFITGTANPHVKGYSFIALEEIISGNNIDLMKKCLSQYLNPNELNYLLDELRKNFTLQNVVGHLTILNPKVLLDNVSLAVENLQDCMNQRFSGKTLIGIYIHICCLIERLVTKTAITDFDQLETFEKENKRFIQYVHDSFKLLSKKYNVTIPTVEIAYLYDFIIADGKVNSVEDDI